MEDSKIPTNKVCKNSNNKNRKKSKKNGYDLAVIATKKIKEKINRLMLSHHRHLSFSSF